MDEVRAFDLKVVTWIEIFFNNKDAWTHLISSEDVFVVFGNTVSGDPLRLQLLAMVMVGVTERIRTEPLSIDKFRSCCEKYPEFDVALRERLLNLLAEATESPKSETSDLRTFIWLTRREN